MLRHLRKFHDELLLKWKPIHLCWLFNRMGWRIPKYFVGTNPNLVQTHFEFGDNDNSTADNCTFDTEVADRVDGEGGNQVSDVPFMVSFHPALMIILMLITGLAAEFGRR